MTYGVFAFGLCDRAVRKGRWWHWIMLGAVLAWASFWQADLWLLFTVFTAIYFVWCCVRERKVPSWKGILLAAVCFFAIGAPSFVDAFTNALSGRDKQIEESKNTVLGGSGKTDDAQSRWIFATNWSMPPEDTLEFFIPRIHGDTSCPMTLALGRQAGKDVRPYTGRLGRPLNAPSGNYRQHSLYVGWVTCLLALLGVVSGIRKRRGDAIFFLSLSSALLDEHGDGPVTATIYYDGSSYVINNIVDDFKDERDRRAYIALVDFLDDWGISINSAYFRPVQFRQVAQKGNTEKTIFTHDQMAFGLEIAACVYLILLLGIAYSLARDRETQVSKNISYIITLFYHTTKKDTTQS